MSLWRGNGSAVPMSNFYICCSIGSSGALMWIRFLPAIGIGGGSAPGAGRGELGGHWVGGGRRSV